VVKICFVSEIISDTATVDDLKVDSDYDNRDIRIGKFVKWRTAISDRNPDSFSSIIGVLPLCKYNFRIVTAPLAKASYWQPHSQSYGKLRINGDY
jgi:hypothetical protein